ncbi:hypothetical protein LSH36_1682g00014 [Paralvinella palmiformis]|uniref:Uncharacterized protein n=1 Tax=Paralvinella palmiformis TaxID=53620 RepID=A0AAD9IRP8_9ANNE|nr:hypothetical protein LSH36_1682g00014 [Paralvinella palmiformis]
MVNVESPNTAWSTYDQLDPSRDQPVEPSTYDKLSMDVLKQGTSYDKEATYEL